MLERLQQHAQDHHSAITALSTEQGDAIVRAAQAWVAATPMRKALCTS